MATNADQRYASTASGAEAAALDQGLRKYMLGVYNYMASGLLLSGITAFLTVAYINQAFPTYEEKVALFSSVLWIIIAFSPLAPLLLMNMVGRRRGSAGMSVMYWLFVGLQGVGMSTLAFRFGAGDITLAFMVTAASFGALSLYGYTTRRNLAPFHGFLIMGVVGLLLVGVAGMFFDLGGFSTIIAAGGVLIFAGLTAVDTQRIKTEFIAHRMEGDAARMSAISGATHLYLNFIIMFQYVLMLIGNRE